MRAFAAPRRAHEVAAALGLGCDGPDVVLAGVAPLDEAGADALAFASPGPRSIQTGAGGVFATTAVAGPTPLLTADPLASFCQLLATAFPEPPPAADRIHPSARIHSSARLHPGVVVGADCDVGPDCELFPNVVLYPRVRLGARVRIHAGAVLGADGFRYHPTPRGPLKVPHIGGVVVGDDVEIGANSCVDRGMLGDTTIGRGAKLDNLVQVGHNGRIGAWAILVAQVGLSGSVTVGDGAILAGQVGVKDHVTIGAGARLGARSAVHTDIPAGETWLGEPARPVRDAMKVYAALRYLPELVRKLR
jgi:UDP-3-O-[3-hydroxymyristoyl] glucosamine N-acyltransferase